VDVEHADAAARHAWNVEARHAARAGVRNLDLDLLVVHLAVAQLPAEGIAGGRRCRLADERFQNAFFRIDMRARLDVLEHLPAHPNDGGLNHVADDLLDVAADIADLGELGRLDLDEGRIGKPGQTARYLGLADAGRPVHQDVLWRDFLTHLAFQL